MNMLVMFRIYTLDGTYVLADGHFQTIHLSKIRSLLGYQKRSRHLQTKKLSDEILRGVLNSFLREMYKERENLRKNFIY